MSSPLGNAIEFLRDFGLFDVIVPFILVFTIVYAILEKTKILGVDSQHNEGPQKNLNGAIAFVVGMIVVATANVVSIINSALPNIILVSIISLSFLLLIGIFWKNGEMEFRTAHKGIYNFLVFLFLVVVICIFLAAIPYENTNILMYIVNYVLDNLSGAVFGSFVILALVVGVIYFLMKGGNGGKPSSEEGKKEKTE